MFEITFIYVIIFVYCLQPCCCVSYTQFLVKEAISNAEKKIKNIFCPFTVSWTLMILHINRNADRKIKNLPAKNVRVMVAYWFGHQTSDQKVVVSPLLP